MDKRIQILRNIAHSGLEIQNTLQENRSESIYALNMIAAIDKARKLKDKSLRKLIYAYVLGQMAFS